MNGYYYLWTGCGVNKHENDWDWSHKGKIGQNVSGQVSSVSPVGIDCQVFEEPALPDKQDNLSEMAFGGKAELNQGEDLLISGHH